MATAFELNNAEITVNSCYGQIEEEKVCNDIKAIYDKEESPEVARLEKSLELINEQHTFGVDLVYEIKKIAENIHCSKGFVPKDEYKTAISRIVNLIEESYFEL